MKIRDVIVVGGGISGLTAAWHLKNAGIDVALLEASDEVGGCMRTEHRDGFLLEKGPFNVIVRDPAFEELLTSLAGDLNVVTASRAARSRYIYRHGRLMAVPTNPVSLAASGLLSFGGKCRALAGLLASRRPGENDCTIADFAARRFGKDVSDSLVSAAVAGILAGDIRKLSVQACFPSMWRFDRQTRSPLAFGLSKAAAMLRKKGDTPRRRWRGLVSIDRGLGAIGDAMAKRLGTDAVTGCRVEEISVGDDGYVLSCGKGDHRFQCHRLVVASSAAEASRLLRSVAPEAGGITATVESASLTVLNLAFRCEHVGHPMSGFGFLVPHNEPDFPLMGVLWADSAFPHHGTPEHRLVRVFIGGSRTPDVISRGANELAATAVGALRDLLQLSGDPTLVDVCPYPSAIPQYYLGHVEKIERLRAATAAVPGLHLVGNYLDGVSINDCVRLAKTVAGDIIREGRRICDPVVPYPAPAAVP